MNYIIAIRTITEDGANDDVELLCGTGLGRRICSYFLTYEYEHIQQQPPPHPQTLTYSSRATTIITTTLIMMMTTIIIMKNAKSFPF